jgi:AhpD family alkylhydroperoxidase
LDRIVPGMTRVDIQRDARDLYRAYCALDRAVGESGLDTSLAELVKLRASMLNGCAYCVDSHSRDALALGDSERRLIAVAAWRESPLFTPAERAALAFTDAVTKLDGIDDACAAAGEHFDDGELTALLYAIVTVNGWNRLAIATHMVAE